MTALPLTAAFVHPGPPPARSCSSSQPFSPLFLHPLLDVLQTLLEGLLLDPFP